MRQIIGDLLAVERGIILHGCNTEGVMGAGIAREVKRRYPEAFAAYSSRHRKEGLFLGTIIPVPVNNSNTLWVVNGITQRLSPDPESGVNLSYTALRQVLIRTAYLAKALSLPVNFPLIGCGLAGGDWEIVSEMIEDIFHRYGGSVPTELTLYTL